MPEGSSILQVSGLEQGWYVKSARFGVDDVFEKGLQLEKENASAKLEIVVSSDSAQLEGSVSDGDHDLVGARVRVDPDPKTAHNRHRSRLEKTDQAGHFAVTGMPPGKYMEKSASASSPALTVTVSTTPLGLSDSVVLK